jgi:hypothetical protein
MIYLLPWLVIVGLSTLRGLEAEWPFYYCQIQHNRFITLQRSLIKIFIKTVFSVMLGSIHKISENKHPWSGVELNLNPYFRGHQRSRDYEIDTWETHSYIQTLHSYWRWSFELGFTLKINQHLLSGFPVESVLWELAIDDSTLPLGLFWSVCFPT